MTKTTKTTSQVTQSESLEEPAEPQAAAGGRVSPFNADEESPKVSEPLQPIKPQEQPTIEPSQPAQVDSEKPEPQSEQAE